MKIMYLSHCPRGEYQVQNEDRVMEKVRQYASPDTVLEKHYPDDFPGAAVKLAMGSKNVMNGLYHALEVPHLVNKIVQAEQDGFDAVVQSNTFDPGVEAGRLAVSIPVIGPLRTCLTLAGSIADRIGITVPLAGHVPHTWRIIRSYGLDRLVAGISAMGAYVNHEVEDVAERARRCASDLVRDKGAELILPLGGALIPHKIDPAELEVGLGVPVMNTTATTVHFAEFCVRTGFRQSPAAYPRADLHPSDFTRRLADSD